MDLQDVEERGQLSDYYAQNGLRTLEEKIRNLTEVMKVKATLWDEEPSTGEVLAGLEESVLLGNWRASW